jgi:hypothetical protein
MDDKRTAKRILEWKPIGTRIRGRPRKRWTDIFITAIGLSHGGSIHLHTNNT